MPYRKVGEVTTVLVCGAVSRERAREKRVSREEAQLLKASKPH